MIEVCWAWMMENLRGKNPWTRIGWQRVIKRAWNEVKISSINKIVDKVPNQLQNIIAADGEWVNYFP